MVRTEGGNEEATTVGGASKAERAHGYAARVIWTGEPGEGTVAYATYSRDHRIVVPGKPELACSADPAFRGAADRYNPEELFLGAIAACHMLFYLSLCARHGVRVLAYESEARGALALAPDGGGRFDAVTVAPVVTVAEGTNEELAVRLHDRAHERCFIANSCSVPIRRRLVVRTAAAGSVARDDSRVNHGADAAGASRQDAADGSVTEGTVGR